MGVGAGGLTLFVLAWVVAAESSPAPSGVVRGELVTYGSDAGEFGELWIPETIDEERLPIVVVIHGGFWQRRSANYSVMSPLSQALFSSGYAVWNIEYGRVGEARGGWPHTLDHVGAAIDYAVSLADEHAIDSSRLGVLGHSAGGQLAIWSAGREELETGDPGADPLLTPSVVIALAPIQDIERADKEALGDDATSKLLGGHLADVPDRYRVFGVGRGSPEVQVILGTDDDTVPERFALGRFEGTGDQVRRLEGLGHLELISPSGEAMTAILHELEILQLDRE